MRHGLLLVKLAVRSLIRNDDYRGIAKTQGFFSKLGSDHLATSSAWVLWNGEFIEALRLTRGKEDRKRERKKEREEECVLWFCDVLCRSGD